MNRNDMIERLHSYNSGLLAGQSLSKVRSRYPIPSVARGRELSVLSALCELRFGCVSRLSRYMGVTRRSADRYLESLRSKGLVSWFRWCDTTGLRGGTGRLATKCVYCLSPGGRDRCLLEGVVEDDVGLVVRRWRGIPKLHGLIGHYLGIVDIVLGFRLAERLSTSHELLWTLPDFVTCRVPSDDGKDRVTSATYERLGEGVECRPDLVMLLRSLSSGSEYTLYVEYERTSRDLKYFREKLLNYGRLFSGVRRFGNGLPILLYVVDDFSDSRDTLSRCRFLSEEALRHRVGPAFRISSRGQVLGDAFGDVWFRAGGDRRWSIGGGSGSGSSSVGVS